MARVKSPSQYKPLITVAPGLPTPDKPVEVRSGERGGWVLKPHQPTDLERALEIVRDPTRFPQFNTDDAEHRLLLAVELLSGMWVADARIQVRDQILTEAAAKGPEALASASAELEKRLVGATKNFLKQAFPAKEK